MSLAEQLHEASNSLDPKLRPAERRKINAALTKAGFGGKRRFRTVGEALNAADKVLGKHGLEWGEVNSAWNFSGDKGFHAIRVSRTNPDDQFSPVDVTNTSMAFTWTKLDNSYEVISYMG